MNCREISEFLREFVAGDLDDDVRTQFERHVADCTNCTAFLAQYTATISASRKACEDPQEVPPELVEAILKALGRQP